jgi:maleylpyruvate isomerase
VEKSDTGRELDRDVAGCAAAHQTLLAAVDELSDAQARLPSLLPGWTVGHVLTHLARNADSLVRMIEGAELGKVVPQYPSVEARNSDIEAGSGRSAHALVSDLRRSIWKLEATWASTSVAAWSGHGANSSGRMAITDLPFRRWGETVVHHSDLGLGYLPAEWPAEFVRLELRRLTMLWNSRRPMGMAELPAAALQLDERTRLLWLLGRVAVPDLPVAGILS